MSREADLLLSEAAKPRHLVQEQNVISAVKTCDGSDPELTPMIFFAIESLFEACDHSDCSLSRRQLLKAVIENVTLTQMLYQMDLPSAVGDNAVDQMLGFIASFKDKK